MVHSWPGTEFKKPLRAGATNWYVLKSHSQTVERTAAHSVYWAVVTSSMTHGKTKVSPGCSRASPTAGPKAMVRCGAATPQDRYQQSLDRERRRLVPYIKKAEEGRP